jgi:hypothetical protein
VIHILACMRTGEAPSLTSPSWQRDQDNFSQPIAAHISASSKFCPVLSDIYLFRVSSLLSSSPSTAPTLVPVTTLCVSSRNRSLPPRSISVPFGRVYVPAATFQGLIGITARNSAMRVRNCGCTGNAEHLGCLPCAEGEVFAESWAMLSLPPALEGAVFEAVWALGAGLELREGGLDVLDIVRDLKTI